MRLNYTDDAAPWQNLANAIVQQAARDYAQAIVDNDEGMTSSCERFFSGGWCTQLTSLDGVLIMHQVRKGAEEYKALMGKVKMDTQWKKAFTAFKCPICGANVRGRVVKGVNKFGRHRRIVQYFNQLKCSFCDLKYRHFLYAVEEFR